MIKRYIQVVSLVLPLGLVLVLLNLWIGAYVRYGITWVSINDYGEANIELVLWAAVLPLLVYGTWLNYKEVVR